MSTVIIHTYFFLLVDKVLYYALWWTSIIIFAFGVIGFLANLNNNIRMLISIEILYVSLSCFFISTALLFNHYIFFIYGLFIIFIAALEGAFLLLLCVQIYYARNEVYIDQPKKMVLE